MRNIIQSLQEMPLPVAKIALKGPVHYNLSPEQLIAQTILLEQGVLNDTGALVVATGEFTGRSPKDKFIVKDTLTENTVFWNEFNIPIAEKYYDILYEKMMDYLSRRPVWVRDCVACADQRFALRVRVINETPWANLFCYNMFLHPQQPSEDFCAEWSVIQAPGFYADPETDGTRQHNFSIINFAKKTILIGGSAYTGEIKKGIFTILNYLLPLHKNVLSMHCSANIGQTKDTAIFFGLSGTGKTTLSTDPHRKLIGDDEHGWTEDGVFNFEGGCYAKCIDLSKEYEPEISGAIRHGALLENVVFYPGTNEVNYADKTITENTRVSYPLHYINNIARPHMGDRPDNIFYLTCDAYGVLPPVSKLNSSQAMYQFMSGYTARVAGTEAGVKEPRSTFSACFGSPFLPLHPSFYATLLGKKIQDNDVNVWLINTGWCGGPYGVGKRMSLPHTRAIINAILNGELSMVRFNTLPVFGLQIPASCPNVPAEILDPRNIWKDKSEWLAKARELAGHFIKNFEKFKEHADKSIYAGGPSIE